jgi:hypothetical protein
MSLKNPVTPPGIDPGTIRLVAQRLNDYATPGPSTNTSKPLKRSTGAGKKHTKYDRMGRIALIRISTFI